MERWSQRILGRPISRTPWSFGGVGGAECVVVDGAFVGVDASGEDSEIGRPFDEEVTRRMTRNVHHLMKMESGLDKIVDPLAGSYSIEQLTKEIAQRSWEVFQKG